MTGVVLGSDGSGTGSDESGTGCDGSGTGSDGSGTGSDGSGTGCDGSGTGSDGSGTGSDGSGTGSDGSGTGSDGSDTGCDGSGTGCSIVTPCCISGQIDAVDTFKNRFIFFVVVTDDFVSLPPYLNMDVDGYTQEPASCSHSHKHISIYKYETVQIIHNSLYDIILSIMFLYLVRDVRI